LNFLLVQARTRAALKSNVFVLWILLSAKWKINPLPVMLGGIARGSGVLYLEI
jgi:hypothetical protein